MELLVDGAGWVRERWAGEASGSEASALLDRIRSVRSTAVRMPVAHAHVH
jgi:hypothetical protein